MADGEERGGAGVERAAAARWVEKSYPNLATEQALRTLGGVPEVLRIRGYRFFFFSREGNEPRHIHVQQAERYAKFWLEPLIELAESRGFRSGELRALHSLIEDHRDEFIVAWDEHFKQ